MVYPLGCRIMMSVCVSVAASFIVTLLVTAHTGSNLGLVSVRNVSYVITIGMSSL